MNLLYIKWYYESLTELYYLNGKYIFYSVIKAFLSFDIILKSLKNRFFNIYVLCYNIYVRTINVK